MSSRAICKEFTLVILKSPKLQSPCGLLQFWAFQDHSSRLITNCTWTCMISYTNCNNKKFPLLTGQDFSRTFKDRSQLTQGPCTQAFSQDFQSARPKSLPPWEVVLCVPPGSCFMGGKIYGSGVLVINTKQNGGRRVFIHYLWKGCWKRQIQALYIKKEYSILIHHEIGTTASTQG